MMVYSVCIKCDHFHCTALKILYNKTPKNKMRKRVKKDTQLSFKLRLKNDTRLTC